MQDIKELIKGDLQEVEKLIEESLTSNDYEEHVNNMCRLIVSAGGKRIRPIMTLLCAKVLNLDSQKAHKEAIVCAAAIELLHTATLIHDDVIDDSPKRRGNDTLNAMFGNQVAVLAGDYLFTRTFNLLYSIENSEGLNLISKTIATLVAGEINQLKNEGQLEISYEDYRKIIYAKTGVLFELCATVVAFFEKQDNKILNALKNYGIEVGVAFQIVDDILDYTSDNEKLGKNIGEDLKDKRVTLPIIICLNKLDNKDKDLFKEAIEKVDFDTVLSYLKQTNALVESKDCAKKAIADAISYLEVFEDSKYKEALKQLALFSIERLN